MTAVSPLEKSMVIVDPVPGPVMSSSSSLHAVRTDGRRTTAPPIPISLRKSRLVLCSQNCAAREMSNGLLLLDMMVMPPLNVVSAAVAPRHFQTAVIAYNGPNAPDVCGYPALPNSPLRVLRHVVYI